MQIMHQRQIRLLALICLLLLGVANMAGAAARPSAKIKTPGAPGFVLAYHALIWVGAHRTGVLYGIDPKTNKVVHRYPTHGVDDCGLSGAGPNIVVSHCGPQGDLVNMKTGKVRTAYTNNQPLSYAGSLWISPANENGVLERLDPKSHVVLKRWRGIDFEGPWSTVGGAIWIPGLTTVARVDASEDTLTIIPLRGAAADPGPNQGYAAIWRLALTPGTVWAPNPAGLYRIDEKTNTAMRVPRIHVGDFPEYGNIDIVAANGSLFMRSSGTQVIRINPKTAAVTARYPATGGGGGIAVADGSLWVTNFISDTTWRIPLG